jgi:hypothetical protein
MCRLQLVRPANIIERRLTVPAITSTVEYTYDPVTITNSVIVTVTQAYTYDPVTITSYYTYPQQTVTVTEVPVPGSSAEPAPSTVTLPAETVTVPADSCSSLTSTPDIPVISTSLPPTVPSDAAAIPTVISSAQAQSIVQSITPSDKAPPPSRSAGSSLNLASLPTPEPAEATPAASTYHCRTQCSGNPYATGPIDSSGWNTANRGSYTSGVGQGHGAPTQAAKTPAATAATTLDPAWATRSRVPKSTGDWNPWTQSEFYAAAGPRTAGGTVTETVYVDPTPSAAAPALEPSKPREEALAGTRTRASPRAVALQPDAARQQAAEEDVEMMPPPQAPGEPSSTRASGMGRAREKAEREQEERERREQAAAQQQLQEELNQQLQQTQQQQQELNQQLQQQQQQQGGLPYGGGYPGQQGEYPGYPKGQGGYPGQQQGGYPRGQGGYPGQQ